MLKKFLALLLCLMMVTALVACGETTGDNTQGGENSDVASNSESSEKQNSDEEDLGGWDEDEDHIFLATDIENHSIIIIDLALSTEDDFSDLEDCIVWEWDSDKDDACKGNPGAGIDAAKLRYSEYYKKDVIVACSSSGWAGIIDYKARTVLWEWAPRVGNFHSVELMPNGDVVIAGSSDDGKIYYVPLSAGETKPSSTIPSPHGHGVMWDPENEWLWCLDFDEVYACQVINEGTANAKLVRLNGIEAKFEKDNDGHVLSPIYGEPGKYWVANSYKNYIFDATDPDDLSLKGAPTYYNDTTIKGIAYYPDKTMVMTVAGSGEHTNDWSCGEIRIVKMVPSSGKVKKLVPETHNIALEGREFYKVHPLNKNYQ